ncbi:hypothetical protein NL108_003455, partial [Boleophthalmus pectinirostris]
AAEEVLERKCDGGGEVNQLGLPVLQGKQTQGGPNVILLFKIMSFVGPKSQLTSRQGRSQRVRPLPTQQIKEDSKQNRHPFVLYASGEKDSDIARRKTHNVRPVASTKE